MPLPVSRGGSFHSVGCKLSFGTSPRVSATSIFDLLLRGAEQVLSTASTSCMRKNLNGDIYQTFVYAFALSGQSADGARAGILYPSDSPALRLFLESRRLKATNAVSGIGFDVVNILNAMGNPANGNRRSSPSEDRWVECSTARQRRQPKMAPYSEFSTPRPPRQSAEF